MDTSKMPDSGSERFHFPSDAKPFQRKMQRAGYKTKYQYHPGAHPFATVEWRRPIEYYIELASQAANAEFLQIVDSIMRRHPEISSFYCGMGTWFFADKDGKSMDDKPYMSRLSTFWHKWYDLIESRIEIKKDNP
jgi:hypothetical protein